MGKGAPDQINALFREAGWDITKPIVILQPTDRPAYNTVALVLADALRKNGIAVRTISLDWAALVARRQVKGPVEQGGWNIFATDVTAVLAANPATNLFMNAGCEAKAWIGWPCDEKIEALRAAFVKATDDASRKKIAEDLQKRAVEYGVYVLWGQYFVPIIYRDVVEDILRTPNAAYVYWNMKKTK